MAIATDDRVQFVYCATGSLPNNPGDATLYYLAATKKLYVGSALIADATVIDNHYSPSADASAELSADASGGSPATWGSTQMVTGVDIQRDAKGHVVGVTVDSIQIPTNPNTDRYVNQATFTDDSASSAASPVKLTLTRAGSDSVTVTANIPKVSATSAGVVPKGATVTEQTATTKFLREDGTWQVPSYATGADTTYTLSAGTGTDAKKIILTPSTGTPDKVTVPYATDAGTVNGKTVAVDVPADAKFTDTTYTDATTSASGLMSSADKTKLNGIATGAEVNQNAFSNITVGSTTVAADAKTDTVTLVAGGTVTLTPDASTDTITISAADQYTGTVSQIKVGTTAYDPSSGVVTLPAYPTTLPASDTTDTYSASGTAPTSGKAVAAALGTLDVTGATSIAASKTISAWSETDGKVSISTQDISITKSQVSDFPSTMTPSSHTHGNIQNGGTLQTTDVAIASGDKLVVTDSSDSNKIARTSTSFDGSTTNKALTPKGTFETFLQTHQSLAAYAPLASPTFTGTPKAPTATAGTNTTQIATTAFVQTAIDNLPEPMVFKGSLGTGGTITALPVDGTAKVGDTYKVITAGTYASKAAKVGDTFICLTKTSSANTWEHIPSGDEPSGTVTSVAIANGGGIGVSGGPITTSGTITISHADTSSQASVTNSGRTYIQSIGVDGMGHVTSISSATETVTDTNTWRNIKVDGTEKLGTEIGTGAIDYVSGNHVSLSYASNKLTIAHADTSTQASVTNSGRTYIQSIGLDGDGHVTSLSSATETVTDTNYYHKTGTWSGLTYTAAKVGSPEDLTFTIPTGTTSTTVALGNHTHATSIATSSGTNQLTLAASTKYSLTAGGTSYIFTTPPDTKNTAGSTDTSSKIFLIGATSQAANPQTYSDNEVYVTSGVLQAKTLYATTGACVNTANSNTAGGVALYSGDPSTYGVTMRGTGTSTGQLGKFGYVQGDWAGYLCFAGAVNRGWVYRHGSSNVASISGEGHAAFNGSVTIGANEANTSGVRQVYNSTTKSLDFVFVA